MLKFMSIAAALLVPCWSMAFAAPPESERVEALIRERLAASWRGDKATWRRHVSDDCVWVGPGLLVGTTADAESEQVGSRETLELKDFQTHGFGPDLMIATYLAVATQANEGALNMRRWRKSDTYRRDGTDWQMIQSVEVAIPWRAIAKVDTKVYDDYVGTYRLRPGVELQVWRDDDKLMMRSTGQAESQTFPAGNDIFFDDGEPGDYLFSRDATGKVIAVIYRNDGNELKLERIH